MRRSADLWLAAGVRTPFAKVDGALAALDAIDLSVPVARQARGPQATTASTIAGSAMMLATNRALSG